MFVRDLELGRTQRSQLEVVADGLPLFGGVAPAIVALRGRVQATVMGGVVLQMARRRTRNSLTAANRARLVGLGGGGGVKKRRASSELWRKHVPDQNPSCHASEPNRPGECDGGHCSFVQPHGHSPPPCWSLWRTCGADGDLPETFDVEVDFLHVGLD